MWHEYWTKNQKGILFVAGIIFFLTIGLVVVTFPSPAKIQAKADKSAANSPKTLQTELKAAVPEPDAEKEAAAKSATAPGAAEPESAWVLYITGAVRRPGVYDLPAGSRLLRLVEAAGGLDVSADPAAVNLAAVLADGLHVHVPAKGEAPPVYGTFIETAPETAPPAGMSGSRVDINRASAGELTALKGIGPVLAGNIVDYRHKNGRFHSVDDLLHVKGIGRVRLEQLRDSVTVGP